ncbi:competence protein [Corynebacterium phocae]|uniref:Competence protein n=1 Tax=Corynebacterium phocae TaxID=161895 RepID=A0A1L7D2L3_9CORY|nr:nicotinamide-nucleotide amidohydrolase family protein [Corynebacterium phocae]APT92358.1 competence protein [Corynebacterium phocae]KAA8724949.1 nicotinamide-nucleotide amidohydrolase family protein [Corynebacterium phocae]
MTAENVLTVLKARGETLAFCESLTAGLAAASVGSVPGASHALRGGLVTYATEVKAAFLGTTVKALEAQGVVSALTAKDMAVAAVRHCGSTWGISLTGVAGPDLQEGHPPGTVFVGIAHHGGTVETFLATGLYGSREEIRTGAVTFALSTFLGILEKS